MSYAWDDTKDAWEGQAAALSLASGASGTRQDALRYSASGPYKKRRADLLDEASQLEEDAKQARNRAELGQLRNAYREEMERQPFFAKGGLIPGKRPPQAKLDKGNTDTVKARLTPKEYVLTPEMVDAIGLENLEALREKVMHQRGLPGLPENETGKGGERKFVIGGVVEEPLPRPAPANPQPAPVSQMPQRPLGMRLPASEQPALQDAWNMRADQAARAKLPPKEIAQGMVGPKAPPTQYGMPGYATALASETIMSPAIRDQTNQAVKQLASRVDGSGQDSLGLRGKNLTPNTEVGLAPWLEKAVGPKNIADASGLVGKAANVVDKWAANQTTERRAVGEGIKKAYNEGYDGGRGVIGGIANVAKTALFGQPRDPRLDNPDFILNTKTGQFRQAPAQSNPVIDTSKYGSAGLARQANRQQPAVQQVTAQQSAEQRPANKQPTYADELQKAVNYVRYSIGNGYPLTDRGLQMAKEIADTKYAKPKPMQERLLEGIYNDDPKAKATYRFINPDKFENEYSSDDSGQMYAQKRQQDLASAMNMFDEQDSQEYMARVKKYGQAQADSDLLRLYYRKLGQ